MRRRAALLVAGLLAGATISATAASPAHAQVCEADGDPVLIFVCNTLNSADPVGWVTHYYWVVGDTVEKVHCKLWPPC